MQAKESVNSTLGKDVELTFLSFDEVVPLG
jgi:hypothetical protein